MIYHYHIMIIVATANDCAGDLEYEVVVMGKIYESMQFLDRPALAGSGSDSMSDARRKRTGTSTAIRQPSGPVRKPGGACHIEQNVAAHHGIRPLAAPRALVLLYRSSRRGIGEGAASPVRGPAFASGPGAACTGKGSACSTRRVCPQNVRAAWSGSMPVAFHQPSSLPTPTSVNN